MLALEPECPGHPAAARGYLLGLASGYGAQHLHGRAGAHQGLLVTVPVEHQLLRRWACEHRATAVLLGMEHELLDQHAALGHRLGFSVAGQEVEVLVAEGEEAARLQSDHLRAPGYVGVDAVHVEPGVGPDLVHHSLGEHGPPAAPGGRYDDLIAQRFQHFDGRQAELRVVVVGEGIGEQHDLSVDRRGGRRAAPRPEPLAERLASEGRQGPPLVDPGLALQ